MIKYEITEFGIKNCETAEFIPCVEDNRHYIKYLQWVAEGNTPIPRRPSQYHTLNENDEWVEDSTKKQQAILARLTCVVQSHLDTAAQQLGYDNIVSLCTYAASSNIKFGAEGLAGVAWRDAVWTMCYQIMADVIAGTRSVPTDVELIAELPVFALPE